MAHNTKSLRPMRSFPIKEEKVHTTGQSIIKLPDRLGISCQRNIKFTTHVFKEKGMPASKGDSDDSV